MYTTPSKLDSLSQIIEKIRTMREYSLRTGFRTTRSQNELLSRLNADDLANVLLALEGNENENNKRT